jgi:VanZ family protein
MMQPLRNIIVFAPPWPRWLAVLVWLGAIGVLLLLPGEEPIVENTHDFIGGTALADWFGHVFLFGVLAALVYWALCAHVAPPVALRATLTSTILLGAAIEASQLLIDSRGASVLDAMGNGLGAALFAAWMWRRGQARLRDRHNR